MSNETVISLILSIPIGIISGLYAGLLVARYQRFADLRLQAKKIILEIGYIVDGDRMVFPGRAEAPELTLIASDLLFLKHQRAAETLLQLSSLIYSSIQDAKMGRISFDAFNDLYVSWQETINAISPSRKQLVRLWAGL